MPYLPRSESGATLATPRHAWPARPHDPRDIVRYLAEFGFTLADLEPEQLAMFVAARNAAPYIEELEIPVASQPSEQEGANLAERETQRTLQLTTCRSEELESRLPSDEMDVSLVGSTEDLPRVFPTQWLLEETVPALFYSKLAGRELLMPIWQRPQVTTETSSGESPERELVEDAAEEDRTRQHAHVLLDCSRTMNDHDRRGTIARGLALAVLERGFQQGARLNLRPFTAKVGQLSSGSGAEALHAISRRVITLANAGQTRIPGALETAVADVRRGGACPRADIVLISDGISRLQQSPLQDEKLHSFILGDLFEKKGENQTIATLKSWSTTFQRIWCNRFGELLAPHRRDLQAAQAVLRAAQAQAVPLDRNQRRRLLANVQSLLTAFETIPEQAESPGAELAVLREELDQAERLLPIASGPAEEKLEANGEPCDGPLRGSWGRGRLRLPDWAWLRRLVARVWNAIVRRVRQ